MKILVGMSGGVDSSVALLLLRDSFELVGATMRLYDGEDGACGSASDADDAKEIASRFDVPHHVFDFREKFKENVINRFNKSYLDGETPNPCIDCNRYIKFKAMLEKADELGCDYIATGHYARTEYDEKIGRWLLKKATGDDGDNLKDQSYVLYNLTQEELSRVLFPLSSVTKERVREIAKENGFINHNKPDSQDICFVPDGDYASFIKKFTGKDSESGDFKDINGKILGKHKGIINYTIGQRKGLGISLGKPAYVVNKDIETNSVIIGDEKDLYTSELIAEDVNLISVEEVTEPMRITAKTRYSQTEQPATLEKVSDNEYKVVFDIPQRAITKGQAVVFYDNDVCLGGGIIK